MEKLYNLEKIRKQRGLSRRELELLSGVSKTTIHRLERGLYNVDMVKLGTLVALAKALKVKVVKILNDDLQ